MSQRVNIQYSVEVDDLQEKIDYLHNRVIKRIDRLNQSMSGSSSFIDLGFIEEIDKVRLKLAQIDIELSDLDRIIKGYMSFKMNSDEVANVQTEQTVTVEE
jgi:hypothetical protein